MVSAFEFDRYLDYPKEDAYRVHQDEKNFSVLKIVLLFYSVITGFVLMATFFDGEIEYDSYAYFISFAVSLLLRIFYSKIFSQRNIRRRLYLLIVASLIAFLASNMVSSVFSDIPGEEKIETKEKAGTREELNIKVNSEEKSPSDIIIMLALIMILFRFPKNDIVQLFSLIIGLPVLTDLIFFSNFDLVSKLPAVISAGLCFVISYSMETKRQKKFYRQYDSYFKRHSESVRMKKELD